jgi:hypothetical protein
MGCSSEIVRDQELTEKAQGAFTPCAFNFTRA